MTLARLRSADGTNYEDDDNDTGGPSEYRFHEMDVAADTVPSRQAIGKGNAKGRFKGKMKRLGMGILELVLGRK